MSDDLRARLQQSLGDTYRLERELGGGGMSRVFTADDLRLGRKIVVKMLSPELAQGFSVERFEREVRTAAALQQANIVPVLSAGDADGLPFYVMPYVEGESLRARLSGGPLPIAEVVGVLRDVTKALAYAHQHGVVHRDIKPDNVMLSGGTAVVTDFGIAKAISAARTEASAPTLTQAGTSIGTPAYMSPEQASGEAHVDHRADIYSLGAMAYELLSGQPVFSDRTPQRAMAAHISEPPRPIGSLRPDVPALLADLVMRCLAKDASARPQSAAEVLRVLESVPTPSGELSDRARRGMFASARRRQATWLVGTVAVLVVATIVVTALARRASAPTAPQVAPSIAVLSFENVSGDTAVEYFAAGIADEISDMLQRLPQLRMVSRLSAKTFKGTKATSSEIGAKLGVAYLLDGTVRRSGTRMRVNVHLIDAASGATVGSPLSLDRDVTDAVAVQEEIAVAVAKTLQVQFPDRAVLSPGRKPKDPAAYDLVLQANQLAKMSEEAPMRAALRLYEQAIALDSNYARAYAGVGFVWLSLADMYEPSALACEKAQQAALRAVAKDSALAIGHAVLGHTQWAFSHDWAAADRSMRRAYTLDSRSPDILYLSAVFLISAKRFDEAVARTDQMIAQDPLSALYGWFREAALFNARRWDDVLAQHRRTEPLGPPFDYYDIYYAGALREKGRYADALAAYDSAEARTHRPWYGKAVTYARMGRTADATRVIAAMEALAKREHVMPEAFAMAYASLRNTPRALEWLEKVLAQRASGIGLLSTVEYDPIRNDPRFQSFVKRTGAPR